MNIKNDWIKIKRHFSKSFGSSLHVSVASLDSENNPTVTPIGSLFLNDDQTGFYFEKFPTKLPLYAKINRNICILGVNSSRVFWIKSLFLGKFSDYPAIKLYGQLGEKRQATEQERKRLKKRMTFTNGLKGNTYLWNDMDAVREINFTKADKINLGKMTEKL